jgi:hypothetical protein
MRSLSVTVSPLPQVIVHVEAERGGGDNDDGTPGVLVPVG